MEERRRTEGEEEDVDVPDKKNVGGDKSIAEAMAIYTSLYCFKRNRFLFYFKES